MLNLPSRSSDAGPVDLSTPFDKETGCTEQEMQSDIDPCALREKIFKPFPRRDPSTFLNDLETHDSISPDFMQAPQFVILNPQSAGPDRAEVDLETGCTEQEMRQEIRADARRGKGRKGRRVASALRTYVTMTCADGAA